MKAFLLIIILTPGYPPAENKIGPYPSLAACREAEHGVIVRKRNPNIRVTTRCVVEEAI